MLLNTPHIPLGMIGRFVAFTDHIQVKGTSELFGADLAILTVLPGQFDEMKQAVELSHISQGRYM